jgi:DUF4097 and DUF4098 domain-containing protein YvlB
MSRKALQILSAAMFIAGLCLAARAQSTFQTAPCDDRDGWNTQNINGSRFHHCELRTTKLTANGQQLEVDAENGGIAVVGEDRSDIQLEARVESWANSQADADKRAQETTIHTDGNRVYADTPRDSHGQNNEAVSFRLHVPRHYSVKLDDVNGGISVANLDGSMKLTSENGGISLRDVAGDVQSRSVNGSINIAVGGDRWQGTGVVAETTNGSASITLPENYSAHLEAGVINGTLRFEFPLAMSHFDSKQISADIGKGGAPIRLHTVNGSVSIRRERGDTGLV